MELNPAMEQPLWNCRPLRDRLGGAEGPSGCLHWRRKPGGQILDTECLNRGRCASAEDFLPTCKRKYAVLHTIGTPMAPVRPNQ